MKKITNSLATLLYCLLASSQIYAQIYTYKDKEGKIHYTDQAPIDNAYKEVELKPVNATQVDPSLKEAGNDYFESQASERRTADVQSAHEAMDKLNAKKLLESAQKALNEAKQVRSGDMYPNKKGGARYTAQYDQRVKAAEQAVKNAQVKLEKLMKGK